MSEKITDVNALREAASALNEEARLNFRDPSWRFEKAAEMTEVIYEGFDHENVVSLLTEVENIGWNDQPTFREVRGLKAFWVARGGYIQESQITEDVTDVPREIIGFHVSEHEDKLESNFSSVSRNIIDLGIQRLDAEINRWVLSMFRAGIDVGNPNYHSASGLSLATVNAALASVRDASRTREVSIVGRATMTDQFVYNILGSSSNGSGYLPETNEDLIRRGVLGTYMGAKIVSLKNYTDENNVPFVPANELYIVARDAGKTWFLGGMKSNEWMDPAVDYWHFKARKEVASALIRPERAARIIDTSV